MRTVGTIIKERREKIGMSSTDLASALGVTVQAVSNWEKQPNRAPSRDLLSKLASVLGVEVKDLLSPNQKTITDKEQEVLSLFRQLTLSEQELLARMLRGALKRK